MDSSVSPKDKIWFLRVCHDISTGLYRANTQCCTGSAVYHCYNSVCRDVVGLLRQWFGHSQVLYVQRTIQTAITRHALTAFWLTIVVEIYALFGLRLSSLLRIKLKRSFSGTRLCPLLRQSPRETNNHTGPNQLVLALRLVWGRGAFQYLKILVLFLF